MAESFKVTLPVGGKINQVDLIKKIAYPEPLLPDGVDSVKRKSFRLEVGAGEVVTESYTPNVGNHIYLNELSVTPEKCEDLDYWELDVDGELVCETMYTMEVSDGEIYSSGFEIYTKVLDGQTLNFTFHNDSGVPKRVWFTISFIYQKVDGVV